MAAETELNVRVKGRDELSPTLAQIESRVIRWVGAISAALAAVKIGAAPITAAANFERELANVQKTTNFATSEINELSKALLSMSTRIDISALDLAKIAAAAGQQGLGKFGVEGVIQFTDSVSRMASVLDITAEDAADNIGKLVNIFKIPLKDIEGAVSTFNEVSNNAAASGKDLLDVVRRIGDAAGQLNLQDAVSLAATGLEFGQSPEVVGTAYAKMFSSMREKANDFARLTKTNTDAWIKSLDKGGVDALKNVLAELRNLKPQDQQNTIVKMFGGGRIGSLVNKLVQDTSNAVLDKNIQNATNGAKGMSALKEQQTVLKTLVAQSQSAINSFFKLGVEVGNTVLDPLTKYVAQLNQALQSDGLKSFLTSVAAALMDMVNGVITAVKFVASLNVNWENFIGVAKAFIALKLGQYLAGTLAGGFSSFGNSLQYVLKGTKDVTAAQAGLATAVKASSAASVQADTTAKTSMLSRLLGYEELSQKAALYKAALLGEAEAQRAAAAAAAQAQAAKNAAALTGGRNAAATSQVGTAAGAVSTAKNNVANAQAALAAKEQAVAAQQAAKMQAISAEDFAKRLLIEEEFQTKKAALTINGSRAGVAAITAERNAAMAAEDTSYARSLAATQSYYARKLAMVQAGEAGAIAAEKAALAARLSALDGALTKQAGTSTAAAASGASVSAANAALAATTVRLTAAQKAADLARAAVFNFGVVMKAVGAIVATAGRLIASGLFWVTILYSIADAFGLLDGLGDKFRKLTDAIGLTSAKSREMAVEDEKRKKRLTDEKQAVQDLIDKYKEFVNQSTGSVNQGELRAQVQIASTSEDDATKLQAIAKLNEMQKAIQANRDQANRIAGDSNQAAIDAERARIVQFNTDIAKLQKEMANPLPAIDFNGNATGVPNYNEYIDQIQKLKDQVTQAEANIVRFGVTNDAVTTKLAGLGVSIQEVNRELAGMFTPDTLKAANDMLLPWADLSVKVGEAEQKYKDLQQAARGGEDATVQAANAAEQALVTLRAQQDAARDALLKYVDEQLKRAADMKVPVEVINSWQQLRTLIAGAASVAQGVVAAANAAAKVGGSAVLTGKNANPNTKTQATGDRPFSPKEDKSAESKARKEARARLELERASIQAENALKEAQSKTLLDLDTIQFDRGLKAFRDYYAERARIQLQANQFDIDDKKRELAAITTEQKNATEKSEIDKFAAQAARVRGQIAVLEEQRKGIQTSNAEELRRGEEQFADRIRTETNKLADDGIIPRSALDSFQGNLDEMLASYRVFIEQLKNNGQGALADTLIKSFNVEALKKTLDPMSREFERTQGNFQRIQQRIALAATTGAITSTQANLLTTNSLKAQIPVLEQLLAKQQAQLDLFAKNGDTQSQTYKDMAAAVDQTRLSIQQLGAETNKVATDFNNKIGDSLSEFLGNVEFSLTSVREGFLKFLLSIAQNIQKTLGKSISDSIMSSLGQTGSGGIGGWIQNLTQGKDSLAASGLKGATARGATPATPLFVTDATKALTAGVGTDPIKDLLKTKGLLGDEAKNPLEAASEDGGFFSKLSSSVGSSFGELTSGIGSIFTSLMSTLTSLFTSLIAAMSTGGSGGFATAISGAFGAAHTGGTAGSPTMFRNVSPAVFRNAARYHNGGVAGLKPKEVPTILEEGETIRTQQQERALQQQLNAASTAGAGAVKGGLSIRNVLVADKNFVSDGMTSAEGETAILSVLQKNRSTLKQLVR